MCDRAAVASPTNGADRRDALDRERRDAERDRTLWFYDSMVNSSVQFELRYQIGNLLWIDYVEHHKSFVETSVYAP